MDNNCIEIVRALPRQLAEHVQRERGRKEDGEQAASMYRMHALSHQVAEHLHEDRGKTQEGGNAALILNACAVTPAGGAHAGRRTGKGARREIYLETACRRCHAVWRSTCGGTRKERDRRQNNIWREPRPEGEKAEEAETREKMGREQQAPCSVSSTRWSKAICPIMSRSRSLALYQLEQAGTEAQAGDLSPKFTNLWSLPACRALLPLQLSRLCTLVRFGRPLRSLLI
ncbi:unnamed protein product [Prorocentrum cordatum]|uniref:Uncharacterized protein n=1 Tax=Prorocentrum cordatum TaxID=2364126 RepID=A0ABN9RSP6_9DINO|nr:unnamed protein product [Polarella glacialis]